MSSGNRLEENNPPAATGGSEEKGTAMILDIIKVLIALPASMIALVKLYRLGRPGTGRHRKK